MTWGGSALTTQWAVGEVGGGAQFSSSSSQYLTSGSTSNLDVSTGDLTIAGWIWMNSAGTGMSLGGKRSGGNGYNLRVETGHVRAVAVGSSGTTVFYSTGSITSQTWTHIAMTRAGSVVSLYINGAVDSSSTLALGSLSNSIPFELGRADQGTIYWEGVLDEVGVWTRTLSGAEITALAGETTVYPWGLYSGGIGGSLPLMGVGS